MPRLYDLQDEESDGAERAGRLQLFQHESVLLQTRHRRLPGHWWVRRCRSSIAECRLPGRYETGECRDRNRHDGQS